MFQMTYVQIPEFDWLPRQQKGYFLLENSLLRKHKFDEADTLHTCL